MVIRTPEPAVPIRVAAARVKCAAAIEQVAREVKAYQYHATLDVPSLRRKILAPMPGSAEFFAAVERGKTPPNNEWSIATYTVPILSAEQEYHLFRRMNYHKHRAAQAIAPLRPTFGDLRAAWRVVETCQAWLRSATADRNLIANANIRAVYAMAGRIMRSRSCGAGVADEHHEILSSCQMTLLGCIRSFAWHRRNKLSTYLYASTYRNAIRSVNLTASQQMIALESDGEILATDTPDPAEAATADELSASGPSSQLAAILETAKLSDREQAVVSLYHGLNGSPMNHRQIADRYGLTKEWSRQTLIRALGKMRQAAGVAGSA